MNQSLHRCVPRRLSVLVYSFPLLLALLLFVRAASVPGAAVPTPAPAASAPRPALNPAGWKQLNLKSGKLRFQDFTAGGE